MVAGGGASVVYADTIADLAGIEDLANYGEYSGGPTTGETQFYAETLLDLMTRTKDPKGRDRYLSSVVLSQTYRCCEDFHWYYRSI
jgi:ATP-citrate lyase beta-subunit